MRIVFFGTPKIATATLRELNKKHEVVAVVTQPDTPKKRSNKLIPSDIALEAQNLNLPVIKQHNLDENFNNKIRELSADIAVVFAFGVILKKELLEIPRLGFINIHPSLLPKYRGCSPITTAILNGENESGITVQKVSLKIDSGDILSQEKFNITDKDNSISIEEKVTDLSSKLILKTLDMLQNSTITPIAQDNDKSTYCRTYKKEDGLIDWNKPAKVILNQIRAFVNWPGSYTFLNDVKITVGNAEISDCIQNGELDKFQNGEVAYCDKNNGIIVKCNHSSLKILAIQRQGKKMLNWKDFLNGNNLAKGNLFSKISV